MNIPFHKAHITEKEIESVVDTLKSGWLTMGPKTLKFEEEFKEYIKVDEAIALNSATAALHLALKAIGLQKDDEVIVPTTTFVATAEVVTYFGAKPVLCDIEYETHNIDAKKVAPLITKKTKAIIPVHFAGQPCDMDEILNLSKKHNLKVIEDGAHALPSSYHDKMIGSLSSDITCFSFYATKTLATGEGGMAVTNNKEYAKSIKTNRLHGISRDVWDRYSGGSWAYDVVDNGNKYNPTDITSALGLEQLKKLEWMRDKREAIALKYDSAFKEKIETLVQKSDRRSSYHLYVIKVNNRDKLYQKLKDDGINTSVHFIPIHKLSFYKKRYGYKDEDFAVANKVFKNSLSLPIYPDLKDKEVEYIIEKVLKYAE